MADKLIPMCRLYENVSKTTGSLRDGHGWLLHGSTLLEGEELDGFLAALQSPHSPWETGE